MTKQCRSSNEEEPRHDRRVIFGFRHSDFLRASKFGLRHFFLLCTTSLLPSGSRNCAIQQTGVSVFSMSNVTPRDFSFAIVASMSSTSKATVVPSRDGFQAG